MSTFRNAVVSLPGRERIAKTPFGAKVVIHVTAAETGGAFGMWETFTPPGPRPGSSHSHTRDRSVSRYPWALSFPTR